MTYEELVSQVNKSAAKMDADKITDHLAIQVNIEGEAEGAFYIEMLRGNIVVAPYEYYDRDVLLICQASQILAILKGELDPMQALNDGQIRAEGNIGRLGLLGEIIKKTPARKRAAAAKKTTAAKKPAAKKAPAKKTAAKETAKKETAAVKKETTTVKKETAAAKTTAEKPAVKAIAKKETAAAKTTEKAATAEKSAAKTAEKKETAATKSKTAKKK